jgi:hypothetical protein
VGVQTDGELNVDIASVVNAADLTAATPSGAVYPITFVSLAGRALYAQDYGASGSSTTTTGTITGGTNSLALAAKIDFTSSTPGIRINHAGAAYALNPPTSLSVTPVGTTGATAYQYQIACTDGLGGVDAAITAVSISNGNAAFGAYATAVGNISFSSNPAASSTITLGGTVVTFGTDVTIGATLPATLINLLAFLEASVDANLVKFSYSIADNSNKLLLYAKLTGTTGNALTLAASTVPASHGTVSGANLSGGTGTYNALAWTAPTGAPATECVIYGNTSGSMTVLAVVPGTATAWNDMGAGTIATGYDWLPAAPPVSALADWLVTTITSGAGTTTLVLGANATTSATAQTVLHDDTATIQAAIAAASAAGGKEVHLLAGGAYRISSSLVLPSSVTINGEGERATQIYCATGGTGDCIQLGNSGGNTNGQGVTNLGIYYLGIPASGCSVNIIKAGVTDVHSVIINGAYNGVCINQGTTGDGRLKSVDLQNIVNDGFQINSTNQVFIDWFTTFQAGPVTGLGNGIHITGGAGVHIGNGNTSLQANGLLINPTTGNTVVDVWLENLDLDASYTSGQTISCTGGGVARNIHELGVRTGFANNTLFTGGAGTIIDGSSGTCAAITITGGEDVRNVLDGLHIVGGAQISVANRLVAGNSAAGSGYYSGVDIEGGDEISITNTQSGTYPDGNANKQAYGYYIESGFSGNLTVSGGDAIGNVTSGCSNVSTSVNINLIGIEGCTTVFAPTLYVTNPTTGAVLSSIFLQTGTANSATQLAVNDNSGSPYVLWKAGSAISNWYFESANFLFYNQAGNTQFAKISASGFVLSVGPFAGGTAASSNLIIESTTGAGTTDYIDMKTGSQVVALHLDTTQHARLGNATAPTITSGNCGSTTNGTIAAGSNDHAGLVRIGAAATATCTISFGATWATAPRTCHITPANAAAAATATTVAYVDPANISATQFVITGTVLANANYEYWCQ